jgi:hypothetical protein
MPKAAWVEELRSKLSTSDSEECDEVEFVFAWRPQWRAAEAQRAVAFQLGEDYGYRHMSRRFEGEAMVWTFRR